MQSPRGYRFGAVGAGFKHKGRLDLGLIVSEAEAVAAGVFTKNIFQAAPVTRCREVLGASETVRAIVANSGQANACTGAEGMANCRATQDIVAQAAGVDAGSVLTASTGVIGAQLRMDLWDAARAPLAESLGSATFEDVAKAIMTTDTRQKVATRECQLSGGTVRLAGMAKGAGMISPNMATMLGFVICDARVSPGWWRRTLHGCADLSFNSITVDGDTSTNDTLLALANGASGVEAVTPEDRKVLRTALLDVCQDLAYMIVQDAEGGTKVARIRVTGAADHEQAELAARAVGNSPLVKTALFGRDANWGRVVAAVGRSGAEFKAENLVLAFGDVEIFRDGTPAPGDMDALLAPVMEADEVLISVELGAGSGQCELLASDLTKEYISINADYRT